jgi:hypothetical protein
MSLESIRRHLDGVKAAAAMGSPVLMVGHVHRQRAGGMMDERVRLEREVYRLTQLIGESSSALQAGSTPEAHQAELRRAVELRADVLRRLEKLTASLPEEG